MDGLSSWKVGLPNILDLMKAKMTSLVLEHFVAAVAGLFCLGLLATGPSARAGLLASETFEGYNLGPLSGQGGGFGWTGNWTAPGAVVRADVVNASMSYSVPSGGTINGAVNALEVQLSGAPASQFAGVRTLATPIAETFYVGYLVRYQAGAAWAGANNTFTLHLGTNATATGTLNFGLRGDAGGTGNNNEFILRYGTGGPVSGASTGGQVVDGTDYYLVAKVNYAGGLFTSANMWLNPSATDDVDTVNGDASLTLTTPFANPISHIFFREAVLDADDVLRADELRIGTAWGDVVLVPEPGSVALLSLGAAAMLIFRRIHRRA